MIASFGILNLDLQKDDTLFVFWRFYNERRFALQRAVFCRVKCRVLQRKMTSVAKRLSHYKNIKNAKPTLNPNNFLTDKMLRNTKYTLNLHETYTKSTLSLHRTCTFVQYRHTQSRNVKFVCFILVLCKNHVDLV